MPLHDLPKAHGTIAPAEIIIKDRLRKDTPEIRKKIDEVLIPSIAEVGLVQPITLENDEKTLVAGWCRLQALTSLGYEQIPYNTQREMPQSDKLLMELVENRDRPRNSHNLRN